MSRKFRVVVLVGLLAVSLVAGAVWAKGGATPLRATWMTLSGTGFGVFDDGNAVYEHGVGGVQCYFGVSGKDVDVVTYNTARTLRFKLDPNNSAVQASGLPADFLAESDMFGINYFGRYREMGIGTTAQVQADLEFYVGKYTYELDYPSLAVMRVSENTWRVTSDPAEIGGDPGFTASDEADLNIIRRNRQTTYGTVHMPIRFEVTIK
ncbi:MAG TPA: hypothetical protein VLB32_00135 [Candidatus Acidoferrales bacterium]|nr:hypothetical protein [Candidatus Acidoferrales bacterium]